jgi:hypothetical protein
MLTGAFPEARRVWNESIWGTAPGGSTVARFRDLIINEENLKFLRKLIRESKFANELLPLAAALDYLETGDRSPLEKLSAEVRPIAEEIVAELQKKLLQPAQSVRLTSGLDIQCTQDIHGWNISTRRPKTA